MGIPIDQAGRLSPWQYTLCLSAWNRQQGGPERPQDPPMSIERMRELGIEGV